MDGSTADKAAQTLADLAAKAGTTPDVLWQSMVSHARWDAIAFVALGVVAGAFGLICTIFGMVMLRRAEKKGDISGDGVYATVFGLFLAIGGPVVASHWVADITAPEAQAVKDVMALTR